MKGFALTFLAFIILVAVASAGATDLPSHAPKIKVKEGTSTNWSGYAVPAQKGAVTDVKATWTVPAVSCTTANTGSQNTYSSVWVGIDGDNSNTVEQIGTEQDCINGQASYYTWYEMYPKFPVNQILPVSAGDSMTAEVAYIGSGQFRLTLTNNSLKSSNKSFSTVQKLTRASLSSAEWIVEAPWSGGVLPLADFGTATFTSAQATIGGATGPIGNWSKTMDPITMVSSDGSIVKAQPSGLSSGGSSFSVAWEHY